MKVHYTKPVERGVTTLAYIGDDDAVEKAISAPSSKELGIGAVAAIVALQSKGVTRLAATSIAAFIGYRYLKRRTP